MIVARFLTGAKKADKVICTTTLPTEFVLVDIDPLLHEAV